jgi:periplasmic divalent cation tolerance protein
MYSIVYVTAGDREKAEELCHKVVEEGLAACANIHPIRSVYMWKGKIETGDEVGMMLKTRDTLVDALTRRVKELHSYELPCVVSWKIGRGSQEYLDWIGESTKNGQ